MQAITTIGLDIAKSVFQVHGIDAEGKGMAWAMMVKGERYKEPAALAA